MITFPPSDQSSPLVLGSHSQSGPFVTSVKPSLCLFLVIPYTQRNEVLNRFDISDPRHSTIQW